MEPNEWVREGVPDKKGSIQAGFMEVWDWAGPGRAEGDLMGIVRHKSIQDKNGAVCMGRGRTVLGLPGEIQNSHLGVIFFFPDKQQVLFQNKNLSYCTGVYEAHCMGHTPNIICCLPGSHSIGCLFLFPEPGNHSREWCVNPAQQEQRQWACGGREKHLEAVGVRLWWDCNARPRSLESNSKTLGSHCEKGNDINKICPFEAEPGGKESRPPRPGHWWQQRERNQMETHERANRLVL